MWNQTTSLSTAGSYISWITFTSTHSYKPPSFPWWPEYPASDTNILSVTANGATRHSVRCCQVYYLIIFNAKNSHFLIATLHWNNIKMKYIQCSQSYLTNRLWSITSKCNALHYNYITKQRIILKLQLHVFLKYCII